MTSASLGVSNQVTSSSTGRSGTATTVAVAPERRKDWSAVQQDIVAIGVEYEERSFLQEALERFIALLVLIITAPLTASIALWIRLDTPGRAIFRQPRVGRNGHLFRFCKFRTLYADARQRFPELYAYDYTPEEIDRLRFKVEHDPRVTHPGRFLRRTTLDEIINFWNVVTGEMALVGPRPEIPEMLPYYRPENLIKFKVKPGITGLAQISGRGRLTFRETEELDAEYVRTRSWTRDIRIMVTTIYLIFKMDGAF